MATVVPYFERWMKRFPTIEILAAASDDDVVSAWAGLGYYSRARNVLKAARLLSGLVKQRGWPSEIVEWLELPGVGPYTASAIAAIAFGRPVLPIDGNVIRVTARLFGIDDPLNRSIDRGIVEARVQEMALAAAVGSHGDLAQAFMDLGAQVCRAGALARCELCPLESLCQAKKEGRVAAIPAPKLRAEAEKVSVSAFVYRKDGRILLRRIPEGLRLAGQWELPNDEVSPARLKELQQEYEVLGPVRHSITRYRYEVFGVNAGVWKGRVPEAHCFWEPGADLAAPLTTLSRKVLSLLDISP